MGKTAERKTAEIRVLLEPSLKKKSRKILDEIGISESEAVRIFFRNLVIRKEFPIELKIPNEETLQAMKDADEGNTVGPFNSVDELMEELNS
ncbi:MAG: type II toxin-antitoxin system RelB/DinJ family antitoxin [Melioribacteraceae bacterium]|nr:type II toxin-antitoxin system RelB/DinJ family antitoxin [Melioribacteraceae bacterium]MCF8356000.1 type II toxin-antitoxin system RelB/DinJ family antitoxin [Melioribacteraceae bacterium]MCF8419591.1 type II toxin-antitoxin system RelB/DinJ family antitoxin [Melioribacteraceae bacterium]